ncbi:ABC transporter permease [Actomonas aquatica]|uniref:FtsX-like permease family protein n=1 Tax=Actomonas aquatica TaxID=2866162 RepID=A0ABZ1C4U3_9BACT|nr:FtsX-like permease family protein [Opitutus sp. WL0086]WRQ86614.1 FtsX-like permease family protein [Opitutus sp. WL0086]
MRFILKMAWRDSRASRRRLVLASFSIVLGIASLVAIGSFNANLREAIDAQARTLLGADLRVQGRAAFSPEILAELEAMGGQQAREIALSTMIVFPTAENRTRLATLRALEGGYPFYGDFETVPADAPAKLAAGGKVAVLEETLMAQFGVAVGDPIRLGDEEFTVVGALRQIPGDSVMVAMLSPRVFIPYDELEGAGLLGPGSLARHRRYVVFDDGSDPLAVERRMREAYPDEHLGYETVEERKRELGNALRNVYSFLSLVGFVALFLGAIGVASAIHVHIRQKIPTVAVLRCLGASSRTAFGVYLVQGLALGLIGSVVGAAVGVGVQLALPRLVADMLPVEVDFGIIWPVVFKGAGAGLLICGLFSLLPLLAVRRVSPLVAIRAAVAEAAANRDPWRWVVYGGIVAIVAGFALRQAPRWQVGVGFIVALAVSFLVLGLLGRVVAWAARRFTPKRAPYVWRQGIANLHRPNNRTVLLLLALGLGTFLIVTLALTRATLLAQIAGAGGSDRPNLLFFDIQDDQIDPLREILVREDAPMLADAPIVTMRVSQVRGTPVGEILRDRDNNVADWTLRREYRSTFRDHLNERTERITAGEWVSAVEYDGSGVVPISLEQGVAEQMNVALGDEIEWDVQGLSILTRVASLREVEWRRMEPNFFVVFPAGVLEPAPKFYVAATRVGDPAHSARVQEAIVAALPNVSAIDLQLVLETLDGIFEKVQFVIQFMALFTVATGVIVLVGTMMSGRLQRLREVVLLRTLGATGRQLWQIQLVEYAVLGLLSALVGCGLAVVANGLLAHFVFETVGVASPVTLVVAVITVSAITLLTGLMSNRGVTNHPPLEVLRAEG